MPALASHPTRYKVIQVPLPPRSRQSNVTQPVLVMILLACIPFYTIFREMLRGKIESARFCDLYAVPREGLDTRKWFCAFMAGVHALSRFCGPCRIEASGKRYGFTSDNSLPQLFQSFQVEKPVGHNM